MKKSKKGPEQQPASYKTESDLKAEALERQRREQLIMANRKPKSTAEAKAENFWYHYKWITIASVLGVVLLVFLIKDIFFKTAPDVTIIMVTEKYISAEYLSELSAAMERQMEDLNGDGKVLVAIDSIPFTPLSPEELEALSQQTTEEGAAPDADPGMPSEGTAQQDYSYTIKLMTLIAASTDPIYLLDQSNYTYIAGMNDEDGDIFLPLDHISGAVGDSLPVTATTIHAEEIAPYFGELSFYLRDLSYSKRNAEYHAQCMDFLEQIAR